YNILQRVDIKQFGSLVNTIAPFHVKQDSMVHNMIAKAVNMKGEAEDAVASGMVLMSTGVALKPAFSGTGFNENVRVFPDFSLRMYFMESQ
ncbi:MAG: alpha-galactosidase, partial [Clostridia bacterium]|nr:alpha-galactosidase [Clostridia bacterium]